MLGDAIAHALPGLRREAESLMTDTCRITRDGDGEPVFNESTGQYDDPPRVVVYEGRCRIQIRSTTEQHESAGPSEVALQYPELQLPIAGTDVVAVDHQVECLTAAYDPSLVDRVWTITARHEKSHATSRRLRMVEVVGG